MLLDEVPPHPPQTTMSEAASRRIRAVFNVFNFWSIVLYNTLALNSLDFAKLVAKRLFLKGNCYLRNLHAFIKAFCLNGFISLTFSGFPITTIVVMLVTYCLIQVIKEAERRQALIDDPDPLPPPPPPPPPTSTTTPAGAPAAAAPPLVDPSKEKAE